MISSRRGYGVFRARTAKSLAPEAAIRRAGCEEYEARALARSLPRSGCAALAHFFGGVTR